MADENPPMPQPTAEHHFIMEDLGRWKVKCTFFTAPGAPPMESEATEEVEALGPFWTISRFKSDFCGMKFEGQALVGFEPHTGKYVSTWADCFTPALMHMTGTRKGDLFTMTGNAFSCATQSVIPHRMTVQRLGKDERLFEMFCTMPDGNEIKLMSNRYSRA